MKNSILKMLDYNKKKLYLIFNNSATKDEKLKKILVL